MPNGTGGSGSPRVPGRSGVVELNAVPKRGQAAADPSKTWVLDVRTARVLSNTSLGDLIAAICRLVTIDDVGNQGAPSNRDSSSPDTNADQAWSVDDTITVEEAAAALHMERRRLIREARRYPFNSAIVTKELDLL